MSWVRERRLRYSEPDPLAWLWALLGCVAVTVFAVATLWLALSLASMKARGHSFYPIECCSGYDCAPIDASRVQPLVAGGFMIDGSFYIPRAQVRDSMDGRYHACFPKPDNLRCFFAPPRGV